MDVDDVTGGVVEWERDGGAEPGWEPAGAAHPVAPEIEPDMVHAQDLVVESSGVQPVACRAALGAPQDPFAQPDVAGHDR